MAGTNVPLPTFGTSGFSAPSGPAILTGVQADITASFGKTLNYNLNTPQGQLSSSLAAIIGNTYAVLIYYTQQVDPAYASGRMQDALGRISFLSRKPAVATTLSVLCTGLEQVVIPAGSIIQDIAGNLYASIAAGVITGGAATISFACTVPGAVPVPTSISIYKTIPGWDTVAVISGSAGTAQETRGQFEQRRREAVAKNALGPIGAIIGAVAAVAGVTDFYGYNNNTAGSVTVGGVSISAYSIYICVAGGTDADVAQAILSKKGAGAPMVGTTVVTAYDSNPLYTAPVAYTIKFQRPVALQILFKVNIAIGPTVPSDAAIQIQNALLSAFAGNFQGLNRARIGGVIYATQYAAPVAALGAWAQIISLGIGSANTPDAVAYGRISGNTLTVVQMISGAIVVGDVLSGLFGLIANGTLISIFGTGTGGVGTYTVNNPQTVGATFTGTGSGTNLTASAVTGVIKPGDLIQGTGVPANTTIVSGPAGGGAGVYVTSNATTSAGAALTANRQITFASANQALVAVHADQIPQLTAANINLVLT